MDQIIGSNYLEQIIGIRLSYEYLWILMVLINIYEYLWILLNTYEHLWTLMNTYEYILVNTYGAY